MRWSLGQTICTLVVVGTLLVVVNLLLISKLHQQDDVTSITEHTNILDKLSKKMDFSSLPVDSSGQYKIQSFFVNPGILSRRGHRDITMVSHCTANHLYNVIDMSSQWKGPISVAVLVPGTNIIAAYLTILGLRSCLAAIKRQVTIHIVYPLSHPPGQNRLEQYIRQAFELLPNCNEFVSKINTKDREDTRWNYANVKVPYPNNLLRNTALRSVRTDYVFVVDVDMTSSGSLYHDFLKFAGRQSLFDSKKGDKTVFVVPAFESTHKLGPSIDKQQLLSLWSEGSVQPFYYSVCWKCQRSTDYEQWKSVATRKTVEQFFKKMFSGSNSKKLEIAYSVNWKDPWEPFYIGPIHVPLYDERFKQYGFNRISQVCETHIAGYKFAVLSNAFLVHHGFKNKDKFHKSKNEENARNRELFRTFKRDLKTKYPNAVRRC